MQIINEIIKDVELELNITLNNSRKREQIEARALVYAIIKNYDYKISLYKIGKIFDKTHATIIYSLRNLDMYMHYNKKLRDCYDKLFIKYQKTRKGSKINYENKSILIKKDGVILDNYQGLSVFNIEYQHNSIIINL